MYGIVGTDTGVGKTVVTAVIGACLEQSGRGVRVLKPVQTGRPPDDDAAEVNRLLGHPVGVHGISLRAPLGPTVAARLEGQTLNPADVTSWVLHQSIETAVNLVEAAGGVAVEIAPGFDMAALMASVGASAILVCRSTLGTLNHTLLSVRHLEAAGVRVEGLVISGFPARPTLAEATNPAELERLTGLELIGVVPALEVSPQTVRRIAPEVMDARFGGRFDRAAWLATLGATAPEPG